MNIRGLIAASFFILLSFPSFAATNYSKGTEGDIYNAGDLKWELWCYSPEGWRNSFNFSSLDGKFSELRKIPAKVPGSVQMALKEAGIITDWNYELNSLKSEWVTNRSWLYVTKIPDEWLQKGKNSKISFKGFDGNGIVIVNGKEVGSFNNSFIPYTFEITPALLEKNNTLAVIFGTPPTYLGQVYWTSKIRDWKTRFSYGWDWLPRMVQIGMWDKVFFENYDENAMQINHVDINTTADAKKDVGELTLKIDANQAARASGKIQVKLADNKGLQIISELIGAEELTFTEKTWKNLSVKRWWPNGNGDQPLYTLTIELIGSDKKPVQREIRKVGFKNIQWLPNKNAPKEADHWLCAVNGKPTFLQGINWTPILPNFADLNKQHYEKILNLYKDLGVNIIRIWGGGFPEHDWLYELCDELGILIQQDFPLSSSGLDNYPPETTQEIKVMGDIATSYIKRNKHHISILFWCGGNELYEYGDGAPVTTDHPMIKNMANVVKALDPQRRFVPGSPSGANIWMSDDNMGKGRNWDVHGPWGLPLTEKDRTMNRVQDFWNRADALMYSEVGVPGAMNASLIKKYAGSMDFFPANYDNPLWNRFAWWIEWDDYLFHAKKSGETINIENYVKWSQARQAEGYAIAAATVKKKFPQTGGFIIWMGHDSFPCFSNNSLIDFEGNLKPAAFAIKKVFKGE